MATKKGAVKSSAKGSAEKSLAAIKKDLLDKKHDLDQELAHLYQEKFSDDQVQDQGDQALSSTMESLRSTMQDTRLEEYRRLNRALEKIEDGTYGICVDCEGPISEKRLKSFPNAERCLVCQEDYEETKETLGIIEKVEILNKEGSTNTIKCRDFRVEFNCTEETTEYDLYYIQFTYQINDGSSADAILLRDEDEDPETDRGTVTVPVKPPPTLSL